MQDEHDLASEGQGHQFCYVYWEHGPGSKTSLYYLDTPNPQGVRARRTYVPQEDLNDFITKLRGVGWQQYMTHANQEAYEVWLLQPPMMDSAYEYCVLTDSAHIVRSFAPGRANLYRLGGENENLLKKDPLRDFDYEGVLQYLPREGWEFIDNDQYFELQRVQDSQQPFRFYKRSIA